MVMWLCAKKQLTGFQLQKWNIVDVNKFTTFFFFKKLFVIAFIYMPH